MAQCPGSMTDIPFGGHYIANRKKAVLSEEIRKIRLDPFADAALIADSAAALGRVGDADGRMVMFSAGGELREKPHEGETR